MMNETRAAGNTGQLNAAAGAITGQEENTIMKRKTAVQTLKQVLSDAGIQGKVSRDTTSQLTDSGWRGGPTSAVARVAKSSVTAEQVQALHSARERHLGLSISLVGSSGAPDSGTYVVRLR